MNDSQAVQLQSTEAVEPAPESFDYYDVPAAVLCAVCGHSDCDGCIATDEDASGVIAIVPWERSEARPWQRLWHTAQAATQGAESFFAALPPGPIGPALRFAIISEALAVVSMAAMLLGVFALAFPTLALTLVLDPDLRAEFGHWLAVAIPGVTLWMVLVHAIHGLAVDGGARRQGGVSHRRRALRFGFYACGWDLMTSPLGGIVTLFSSGFRAALALGSVAMNVPGRATTALLRGIYALDEARATRARRRGLFMTMLLVVASVVFLVAALFLA